MTALHHEVRFEDPGRTVQVPDNGNLREVCQREGIALYRGLARIRNCGGRARCGTCRVLVTSGERALSAPTPFEKRLRGEVDLRDRLACQANVRGPVVIRWPS